MTPRHFGRGRVIPGDLPGRPGYYLSERDKLEHERKQVCENIAALQRRLNYLNGQIEGNSGEGQ